MRPARVGHVSVPSSPPRQHRDGYVQFPSRVNSLDSYQVGRSVPLPISRRSPREDEVLPSIEREPEPPTSSRILHDSSQTHRYGHSSISSGYHRTTTQAEVYSPKRVAFPLSIHDSRDGHHELASKHFKPVYDDAVPPPQTSMFHEMHNRGPMGSRIQPRVQPDREAINLTSSPSRPSGRDRGVFAVPPGSYLTAASTSRTYGRNDYPVRIPGHWKTGRYVDRRDTYPRSYGAAEARYTNGSNHNPATRK